MGLDLKELLAPEHTALVTQECQRGVIGDLSALPELASAAQGEVTNAIAALVETGRKAGVQIIHCLAERRSDGRGANTNGRLFRYMASSDFALISGTEATELVPEISVDPRDLVLSRLHGLSPFEGTELDSILRNEGIRTVVGVGVSVNVAIQNLTFDAVNAAYQVVLPRDAVAGFPADYVDQVFEHTLSGISTVLDAATLLSLWREFSDT